MTNPATNAEPHQRSAIDWVLVGFVTVVAFGLGILEVLLVPLYAGTVLIPISVLIGVLGNVVLPYLGFSTVRVPAGALLPLAGWIVPVLGLVMVAPPDGDVLVPAGGGPEYVYYALVLLGGAAGVTTFVRSAGAVRVR